MVQITFTIDDAKIPRIISAMKGMYPIPKDSNGNPLFTDEQWAKVAIRRWIVNQVALWEQQVAIEAIVFSPDNGLIL